MMGALAAATYAALVPAVADMERAVELRDDRGEDDEEDPVPTVRIRRPNLPGYARSLSHWMWCCTATTQWLPICTNASDLMHYKISTRMLRAARSSAHLV